MTTNNNKSVKVEKLVAGQSIRFGMIVREVKISKDEVKVYVVGEEKPIIFCVGEKTLVNN